MTTPESLPVCDLQRLVDMHITVIHQSITDGTDGFTPTLIVESFDPFAEEDKRKQIDICMLAVNFNDTEEKHKTLEALGRKYYDEKRFPLGIALACEAWVSRETHCMPREADDRREVLIISAKTARGEGVLEQMVVQRDKKGNIIEGPFVQQGTAEFYLLNHFYKGFWSGIKSDERQRL